MQIISGYYGKQLVHFSPVRAAIAHLYKMIKRMLRSGENGFEGGMSAKKYMKIVDTSKATATRDLQELTALGIFMPIGEGRSTRYELILS